jgi:folate-binding protein YgfZ
MQSDLNVFCLQDELLLDFEPGLTSMVAERLEKYVIADDAQIVSVAPHYGLLTIQGPRAAELLARRDIALTPPAKPFASVKFDHKEFGELYLINHARLGTAGFDLFIPAAAMTAAVEKLAGAAVANNVALCGWQAFETARIEAGIPRFGVDMDETNIPLEAGLENGAISFNKGCYIGQEVISRIKTYSEVAKALRGLRLDPQSNSLPKKGDKLFREGKEVGYVTSSAFSLSLQACIALGYVRKDAFEIGTELRLYTAEGERGARIVDLPFKPA